MEPRREEQKALEPSAEQKPRRFRIVKLEERIAPKGKFRASEVTCVLECTGTCPTDGIDPTW